MTPMEKLKALEVRMDMLVTLVTQMDQRLRRYHDAVLTVSPDQDIPDDASNDDPWPGH